MSVLREFDSKLSLIDQQLFDLEICKVLNREIFVKPIRGETFNLQDFKSLNHFLIENFDFHIDTINLSYEHIYGMVPITIPKQPIDMEGLSINVPYCMKWYRDNNHFDTAHVKNLNINSKLMYIGEYMDFEECELNSDVICTDCESYWMSSNMNYNQFQTNCKSPFDVINIQKNPKTHTIMIFRDKLFHDHNKSTMVYQKRDCNVNIFPYFRDFKNIKDWRFGFSDLIFDDVLMKVYLRECIV